MIRSLLDLPQETHDEAFVYEARDLVLRRLRVGIVLALVLSALLLPLDALLCERLGAALAVRLVTVAVLLVLLAASWSKPASARAEWIAVAAMLTLGAALVTLMRLSAGPHDPYAVLQEAGLILLVVGAGSLLPVGGWRALVLGLLPLLLQVVATIGFPWPGNLAFLVGTAAAVVVGCVVSEGSLRLRRNEYRGRQAREQLLRARADFVTMLTHDIKNPLGVIDGYVEILRDDENLGTEARDILGRIQAAGRRALLLATNLLDVSRIGERRLEPRPEPAELGPLLGQVLANERCLAEAKGVTLEQNGTSDVPRVMADAGLIERVFVNLVDNAIKFTPEGGSVRVAVREADGGAEVVVEDSGPGLSPELEGQLFERFADVSQQGDSTGFGLFVVKSIVEAHGGRVAAANRNDRSGARFTVWLPRA